MSKRLGKIILVGFLAIMSTIAYAGIDGSVDLNLTETTEVSFTTASVNWGTGHVTSGHTSCTLTTGDAELADGCDDFTVVSAPLVIENMGNNDVKLELASNKDAAGFIGGTSPTFKWKMTANETASCTGITPEIYTNVNTTSAGTQVCTRFFALDTKDALNIDLEVVIPSDTAASGAKTATITATATKFVA
jgi:hypothetical protein